MIKILIIDDNDYKIENNKMILSSIYENPEFFEFYSKNSALKFLNECKSIIDLIVLDWNFPNFDQGMPEVGMGEEILKAMQRKTINIDTIICSSDKVNLENEYQNVIGKILYNPRASLKSQYEEMLKHKQEYPNPYTVIERDSPITIGNSNTSDFNRENEPFKNEYEQKKKRQKQLSKWKRKRSSDAWWKK